MKQTSSLLSKEITEFDMKNLRKWPWGILPAYNGFSHEERVRGWQLVGWFIDNGWKPKAAVCAISGSTERVQYHSENYYGWTPYALNQQVHFALHQRFNRPKRWLEIVERYAVTGEEWFAKLALEPIDLAGNLRAEHGPDVADIWTRAPLPPNVSIPRHQIYTMPETAPVT
ncbi:hypothetical protein ASD31_17530 [Rhizobium sp. Root482]|nr:hypothetical protein ASD31_17530 [Rhizobium sp. Root482]